MSNWLKTIQDEWADAERKEAMTEQESVTDPAVEAWREIIRQSKCADIVPDGDAIRIIRNAYAKHAEEIHTRCLELEDQTPNGIDITDGELADQLIKEYAPLSEDIDVAICRMGREIERMAEEIKATWRAARDAGSERAAFNIIERMVDRLGYGRTENNPSLVPVDRELGKKGKR